MIYLKSQDSGVDNALIGKILLWVLPPALVTLVLRGALVAIFRKFIFYCIQDEKDGIPMLREAVDTAFKDRNIPSRLDDHHNKLEAVQMAITAHSHEISGLQDSVGDMPRWIDAVERMETYMQNFGKEMLEVRREVSGTREDIAELRGQWNGMERRRNPRQPGK